MLADGTNMSGPTGSNDSRLWRVLSGQQHRVNGLLQQLSIKYSTYIRWPFDHSGYEKMLLPDTSINSRLYIAE